jgi:Cdc6-like AAA superfamily ATPase
VSLGLWLVHHDGQPVVALQSMGDPHRGMPSGVHIEVMAADRAVAVSMLEALQALALAHNVYRGQMLSFTFSQWGSFGLEFHQRPSVGRDDLILPAADLDAIERHTLGVTAEAERLRAAGRHLKRGLLLYGPPGTGKTYTVEYLCTQMPERTTIVISGQAMGTLGQAAAIARALQPSTVVLEDVDLVATERTMPGMDSNPLLFQLLNEMDGLDEDADIVFVLTTNRVELLEPALAARPGRIDQAVEIRLPDSDARRRLLERYLQGVRDGPIDLTEAVARTDGTSAAFLKELVRRAALVAARDGEGSLRVTPAHLEEARQDMLEHGTPVLRRILGVEA